MRSISIIIFSLLLNFSVFAELIKPNPNINPEKVIKIQLDALMKNNMPYKNSGINQTWEFAHPLNRKNTGPLSNFTLMLQSSPYSLMLEHTKHKIIFVSKNANTANYFVELTDRAGNLFGFTWTVKKVMSSGAFKDCWMTSSVSAPLSLAKST